MFFGVVVDTGPLCTTMLEKGANSFAEILRGSLQGIRRDSALDLVIELVGRVGGQKFLHGSHRLRTVEQKALGQRMCFGKKIFRLDNASHEAEAAGFIRFQNSSAQQ